ncbi:MAG: hypothetical protein JWO53_38, partial [Chlamydiia bacterium]|nr:hypothetical protein [Chlamydiia bacterium]
DEDEVFNKIWLEHIAKRFPKEYKVISYVMPYCNLFQALKCNIILFQEGTNEVDCKAAQECIQYIQEQLAVENVSVFRKSVFEEFEIEILHSIQKGLLKNQSILLDRWYNSPCRIQEIFAGILVKRVLVFSSLPATLEKFNKRNYDARISKDTSNCRLYEHVIPSYINLYRLSPYSKNALFSCKRAEIERVFDNIEQNLPTDGAKSKLTSRFHDLSKERLEQLKNQFLPVELVGDILFITPVDAYDLIIHTHLVTPHQAALEFLKRI